MCGPYKAIFASFNLIRKHVLLNGVVLCLNRTLWGQFLREICPLKNRPPNWHQYWHHNRNPVNSFHAMAVILRPTFGVLFFGGISPSKIGHIAPLSATIQALSKTRVFLLSKKRSEDCFVSAAPPLQTGAIIKKMKRTV
jgi:hypothetical protein